MIVSFLAIALIAIYKMRISFLEKPKIKIYDDYMSLEKTTSIKGIFILIVIFSHISNFIELPGNILNNAYSFINSTVIGQSMVAMFMLYSGYAVMLSAMKKGQGYVKAMPVNRILKVLIHFDFALLIFLVLQAVLGVKYSTGKILLSFIGWESLGNSNWYIFVILVLYLISYISFMLGKDNRKLCVAFQFMLTIVFVIVLHRYKEIWWWDTAMIYPLGMLYCLYKEKIDNIFKNKTAVYYVTLVLCLAATLISTKLRHIEIFDCFKHIFFAFTILLITMKIQIHNKILFFFGKHLFSLYILHRLPMILLDYFGISSNPILFTVITVAGAVVLCIPFDMAMSELDSILFIKKLS